MTLRFWSLVLACAAALPGCGTPSIHPLVSDETKSSDAALVGTWAKVDAEKSDAVYTVAAAGDHYSLIAEDRDGVKPQKWEFELRPVKLGKYRFVDVQATEEGRKQVDDRWSSCFIPAHLFGRYAIDGDTLKFWILNTEWLEKGLADGKLKLAHTNIKQGWTLITAETSDLQKFLQEHAEDPDAFELNEFKRAKP